MYAHSEGVQDVLKDDCRGCSMSAFRTSQLNMTAHKGSTSVLTIRKPFPFTASDHSANNAGGKPWQPTAAAISFDTTTPPVSGARSSNIPASDPSGARQAATAKELECNPPRTFWQAVSPRSRRKRMSAVMMVALIAVALVVLGALCALASIGALGSRVGTNPDPLALVGGHLPNSIPLAFETFLP